MNLKNILKSKKHTPTPKALGSDKLGLFHREWYLSKNPDVAKSNMDPLTHYLKFGEQEGRWPNPYFDPQYYRHNAPGTKKYNGSALEHYSEKGWLRGRNPSRKFSNRLYLEQYPKVADLNMNPLQFHLNTGRFDGYIAFPTALEQEADRPLIATMLQINDSGLFDADWYIKYYTDLWYADINPLFHYAKHGWNERRNPNIFFRADWYEHTYREDIGEEIPLLFYIKKGHKIGHNPSPDFCVETYLHENKDVRKKSVEPLSHYLSEGMAEGRRYPTQRLTIGSTIDKNAKVPVDDALRGLLEFDPVEMATDRTTFDPECMNIHWVIPDFAAGGGGHMTIFRMVHFLELVGHKQTVWINHPSLHTTPEDAHETIEKHFQHFSGHVRFVEDGLTKAEGDIIVATDCWTVSPVLAASNFIRRFYFVQDFEPSFHPMGANYLVAEQTYHEDLDCLCASPWLSALMNEKYDRWARPFWLAADKRIYFPPENSQNGKKTKRKLRVAVYARHFTARRAVELAFLALERLAERGVEFAVDFFGAPLEFNKAPYEFVDHGVASQDALADIFRNADVGVVFSATNYSLVPQEMMACGLPIVELDGESTRAIFPENTVLLAAPHPTKIADAIAHLLADEDARSRQAEAASKWVGGFSWSESATMVETAMVERLTEFAVPKPSPVVEANAQPKASVIIPTLNAGPIFAKVLDAVVNQRTPWPFEILVIDSGSTDETLATVKKYSNVRLHEINKSEFNHGTTRNLGGEMTTGDYIAFLTHDAMPYHDRWLFNLVSSLERHPNAAGVFGKHLAYPDASIYTKRDLNNHFDMLSNLPLALSKNTDKKRWKKQDPQWLQALHFYSDNNSCMHRDVFEKIPYRKVAFGEDQLWAWDIIQAGYEKVYAPQAAVYHSHDYDEQENFERSQIESAFFKHFFGYELIKDKDELEVNIEVSNHSDQEWGEANDASPNEIAFRQKLNAARLKGYLAGCTADTDSIFEN